MRKAGISTLALITAIFATGCVLAIGTGKHPRHAPHGSNLVEIEGKMYVVDVDAGTVRAVEEEKTDD